VAGYTSKPANLLYLSVFVAGGIGASIARLRPDGMARPILAIALLKLSMPVAALLLGVSALEAPPGTGVIMILNSAFAALFAPSAFLFWRARRNPALA